MSIISKMIGQNGYQQQNSNTITKKHSAKGYTPFKLNFGRHLQKGDLIIKKELPKLETFLKELQRSWKIVKLAIEKVKEVMKKQNNKKRQNFWELKQEDNMWLEAKNTQFK